MNQLHHTYSRIDFFLLDARLTSNVVSVDYHSIAISDHAPTSIDLTLPGLPCPMRVWRFNSALLAEETYKQFLQSQLSLFFELNDLPGTDRGTLWEASKAFVRGQLISFISNKRKAEAGHINGLLLDIKRIDEQYSIDPNPNLFKTRMSLQTELDLASSTQVRTLLLKSRQRFYESGDKAGRLLSHQARAVASSRLIPAIKSTSGEVQTDATMINKTFAEFYATLYKSSDPPSPEAVLDNIEFPCIDSDLAGPLGAQISVLEVQQAIGALQTGKSPGPDGFTVDGQHTACLLFLHCPQC